jgi:hypothetical protein
VSNTTCEFEKMDDDIEMLHGIEMEVMRPTWWVWSRKLVFSLLPKFLLLVNRLKITLAGLLFH